VYNSGMSKLHQDAYLAEEQVIAELARLGIGYLSHSGEPFETVVRRPDQLLADIVRQPSSRVRTSLIPLLLARPELSAYVPLARSRLRGPSRKLLELFYSAALFLQRKYRSILVGIQTDGFQELPDLYSEHLGITAGLPVEESLGILARRHRALTGTVANWAGTYENAVQHWLRHHENERRWNR